MPSSSHRRRSSRGRRRSSRSPTRRKDSRAGSRDGAQSSAPTGGVPRSTPGSRTSRTKRAGSYMSPLDEASDPAPMSSSGGRAAVQEVSPISATSPMSAEGSAMFADDFRSMSEDDEGVVSVPNVTSNRTGRLSRSSNVTGMSSKTARTAKAGVGAGPGLRGGGSGANNADLGVINQEVGQSYTNDTFGTDGTGDAGTFTDEGTYEEGTFTDGTGTFTDDAGTFTDDAGTFTDDDTVEEPARKGKANGVKSVREQRKRIRRYRGFSTSISSLFLDESLVCTSVSCFGLLLSQRTEHLLNERNRSRGGSRRGRKSSDRRPSHMLAVTLFATIAMMALTYTIWGFGDGRGMIASGWSSGGWDAGDDGTEELNNYQVDDDGNGGEDENEEEVNDDGAAGDDGGQDDDDKDDYYADDGGGDDNAGGDDYYAGDDGDDNNGGDGDDYYANGDDGGRRTEENDYIQFLQWDGMRSGHTVKPMGTQSFKELSHKKSLHQQNESAPTYKSGQVTISLNAARVVPPMLGIAKVRDYRNHLFNPVLEMIKYEWSDRREKATSSNSGTNMVKKQAGDKASTGSYHDKNHHGKDRHTTAGSSLSGDIGVTALSMKKDQSDNGAHLKRVRNGPKNRHLNEGYYDDYYEDDFGYGEIDLDGGSWIRLFLWLTFLILLGIVGRRRRMRTRYALLRARAEEDELHYAAHARVAPDTDDDSIISSERRRFGDAGFGMREDQYEGACSHTLCGCYPVDPLELQSEMFDDGDQYYATNPDGTPQTEPDLADGKKKRKKRKREKREDCLSKAFSCLLSVCCGCVCKAWVQCFSICALAQEAREVRLLTSPRIQRVDLVTHQPFFGYYREIVALRRRWKELSQTKSWSWGAGCTAHYNALSHLSRYIVLAFTVVTIALVLTLSFNPRANFGWADSLVMLLTFAQSFLVIFIVHWIFHKSDLSLDAVIKFFAMGFVIAMPTAFVSEGVLINTMLFVMNSGKDLLYWQFDESFDDFIEDNYLAFWFVGELINAYLVASLVEEVCKYYAFRAMEHPDLIFLTGLENDDPDKKGGAVRNFTYASPKAAEASNSRHLGDENDLEASIQDSQFEERNEVRTLRQRAAATTTAMISCAAGLACAENFIYVFFFGSANASGGTDNSVAPDLGMLFLRTVFPVHPLCAAMQSIGVIRKFLEDPPTGTYPERIGVGKIVLPAIILHGTFDAALMCISVYIESEWQNWNGQNVDVDGDDAEEDNGFVPYDNSFVNMVAWGSIVATMLLGLIWYWIQNRNQKARLQLMEEREEREFRRAEGRGRTETPDSIGSYVGPEPESKPRERRRGKTSRGRGRG